MAVVTDPVTRLDDHEVKAQRQEGQHGPVRKGAAFKEAVRGGTHANPFSGVHGFLRKAEGSTRAHPDFDRNKRTRWSGIHRDQVELVSSDMDIASENGPAGSLQSGRNAVLGGIPGALGVSTHRQTVATPARLALIWLPRSRLRERRIVDLGGPIGAVRPGQKQFAAE